MDKIEYSSYIKIRRDILMKYGVYNKIINDLTISSKNYITDESEQIEYFFIDGNIIYLPRNYPLYQLLNYNNFNICQDYTNGESINIELKPNIEYRDEVQKNASIFLQTSDYGILSLPPGKGKTFIAIDSITKLKIKTLIIVDQIKLMNQWKNELLNFTNLCEEDIGIIRENTVDTDKPVCIAMIQTIISKLKNDTTFIKKMYDSNFGYTLIDEVHTAIGPGTLTNVCQVIYSKKIIGLSATAYRTNESSKIMTYVLGDKMFKDLTYDLKPIIYRLKIDEELPKSCKFYYMRQGKFNKMLYLNSLKKHNHEYYKSIDFLINLLYKYNRNILILSDIISILDEIVIKSLNVDVVKENDGFDYMSFLHSKKPKIYKSEASYLKNKENPSQDIFALWIDDVTYKIYDVSKNNEYYIDLMKQECNICEKKYNKTEYGLFVSGSEDEEKEKRIVLSTFKMMQKGISVDKLDTLILATPVGSPITLEQSIGRILRLKKGKLQPLVFDVCTDLTNDNVLYALSSRREDFYKKKGFDVINISGLNELKTMK